MIPLLNYRPMSGVHPLYDLISNDTVLAGIVQKIGIIPESEYRHGLANLFSTIQSFSISSQIVPLRYWKIEGTLNASARKGKSLILLGNQLYI